MQREHNTATAYTWMIWLRCSKPGFGTHMWSRKEVFRHPFRSGCGTKEHDTVAECLLSDLIVSHSWRKIGWSTGWYVGWWIKIIHPLSFQKTSSNTVITMKKILSHGIHSVHYVIMWECNISFYKKWFFPPPPTLSCLAVINTETVQAANFKIDHYSGSLHTGTSTLITWVTKGRNPQLS